MRHLMVGDGDDMTDDADAGHGWRVSGGVSDVCIWFS